jgi:hypothetical protein
VARSRHSAGIRVHRQRLFPPIASRQASIEKR